MCSRYTEQLLDKSNAEIYQLSKAWEIQYEELQFESLVARGSFGEVWKALWNDKVS